MFHRSERLLLRPIWPEDWRAVYAGIADEGVIRNLARAPWPYREQDARDFTALQADSLHPKFLVTRARDAAVVGCIGIDTPPEGQDQIESDSKGEGESEKASTVEVGYWIARAYWGRGYATEAGHAALMMAQTLGHRRAIASHFLDNPASGRVLAKLGFTPTGLVIDRHSRGRGEKAPTAEYTLELDAGSPGACAA